MNDEKINASNKNALLVFMFVLFLFLVLINILVVSQFRATLSEAFAEHEKHEAELFTSFITSLVVQRDYAKIVDLVKDWGTARYNIVNIKIESANKYVVAEYKADLDITIPSTIKNDIRIREGQTYHLNLTFDRVKLKEDLTKITTNLILVSVVIFIFLSIILWQSLVKTAINIRSFIACKKRSRTCE